MNDSTHTPCTSHDPVNRWATEHYGFDDEPDQTVRRAAEPATRSRSERGAANPRHTVRRGVIASGLLAVVLAGGFGGAAVAADSTTSGGDHHHAHVHGDGR